MPRPYKPLPGARRPGRAADHVAEMDRLTTTLKMVLLLAGLTLKAPVALYFYSKIVLFQSLLLMSPEDSGFYALVVAVIGLHILICGFVFVLWPEEGWPGWRGRKR